MRIPRYEICFFTEKNMDTLYVKGLVSNISNIEMFKYCQPVCKEAHHDGGDNEKAAHQNSKYEECGASGMLKHLSIESSNF